MYIPKSLSQGDTIGLICTARKIDLEEIQFAIQIIEERDYQVKIGNSVGAIHHQYAGDDELRRKDLQQMLDDPNIKAILVCRGGYGTVRIIDDIVYNRFIDNPKWIIGYSDVTALHSHLNHVMGIGTLHATMPINFKENTTTSIQSLFSAIEGKQLRYKIDTHPLNQEGVANAQVVGGNLSILYSLLGTNTLLHASKRILFLEDLDEYLYHIDRMMIALKRAGKLNNLAGVIVGGMTQMNDNAIPYGKSAEEIISEYVRGYDIPVCFGFPAGHIDDNRAIKLGVTAELRVSSEGVSFIQ